MNASCRFVLALALRVAVLCAAPSFAAAGGAPIPLSDAGEECTIAVLTGKATRDGRPILWKNRDAAYLDNEVVYFDGGGRGSYGFVALINAGDLTNAWIGVNERGFAVLNALSYNLPDTVMGGITNGQLMKAALERCANVAEFESYLRETNAIGRDNPANLAVIDASGGAAVFEAAGRDFVRFDAKDAPGGYLARTNFSLAGDTSYVDTWRYHRCRRLVQRAIEVGGVDVPYLLQHVATDLCSWNLDPYPLPFTGAPPDYPEAYGYVPTTNTINRRTSVASGTILGVLPSEDPLLSTFYAVVGAPVVTIPLPVWVAAGPTPPELDGPVTSPLCDEAKQRTRQCYDNTYFGSLLNTFRLVTGNPMRAGYLTRVERIERWLLPETDQSLAHWRQAGVNPQEMAAAETQFASRAFNHYMADLQPALQRGSINLAASPNPAREKVEIRYISEAEPPANWGIEVVDLSGRRLATLRAASVGSRQGTLRWDGRDNRGTPVASGIYFLRPTWPGDLHAAPVVIVH